MKKGIDYTGIAVVPILHDGQGNYLFGLRTDKCKDEQWRWDALGPGGLEYGETIEEGIIREVREEAGTTPFNIEFLGIREVFKNSEGDTVHWLSLDYRAQVDPEKVKINEPEKFSEITWCPIGAVPQPQHSQLPVFFKNNRDKL